MERSRTQVLQQYLPDAVFIHSSGVIADVAAIDGKPISTAMNVEVLLNEIDRYLKHWNDDDRLNLPLPSQTSASEFQIIEPELVRWRVWPLVLECRNETCGRIVTFRKDEDIPSGRRCLHCHSRLRQLRYYTAHACGRIEPLYVQKCSKHEYEHVYFEDTGAFQSATYRCRACGGIPLGRTSLTPCRCQKFPDSSGKAMMRGYTVRDSRTYYPHSLNLINPQSRSFELLQRHPLRGHIALASYLGVCESISAGLDEADRGGSAGKRLSAKEWAQKEAQLKKMGLAAEDIAQLRKATGPIDTGLAALGPVDEALAALGETRSMLERTALFDSSLIKRRTLAQARADAEERGRVAAAAGIDEAQSKASDLGIEEIAITWNFPIATAVFGYTRVLGKRGAGQIRGFGRQNLYDGKTPIFAAKTDTEAILVTVSARRVLEWLIGRGLLTQVSGASATSTQADRRQILEIFACRDSNPAPADAIVLLLHSMAHALLRALDDGQIGFAESSLAEWLAPETLTFAIYASSMKSDTLGALWTLINNRTLMWLEKAHQSIWTCENDPLCHQRPPRACERCLYLSTGCRLFNDQLSRSVLGEFWRA